MAGLGIVITGNSTGAIRALQAVESRTSRLGGALKRGIGLGVTGLLAGTGAAVGAIGFNALKTAAQIEVATAAFTTLTGSVKQANQLLADIKTFAINSPFDTSELIDSSKLLLNVGISAGQVVPTLKVLGSAVAAAGGGTVQLNAAILAFSQTTAAGSANLQDLNQLLNAGIPIYQLLAQASGKTVAQIKADITAKKISPAEVFAAIDSPRYKNALSNLNATLTGQIASLKDTFTQGLADAAKPLLPAIKRTVTRVSTYIGKALPVVVRYFERFGNRLSQRLPQYLDRVFSFLGKIPVFVGRAIAFVKKLPGEFSTFITALGPLGHAIAGLFSSADGAAGTQGALSTLNTSLTTIAGVLTTVVNVLASVKHFIDDTFGQGTTSKVLGVVAAITILNTLLLGIPGALAGIAASSAFGAIFGAGAAGGAAAGAGAAIGTAGAGLGIGGAIGFGINKLSSAIDKSTGGTGKTLSDQISDGLDKIGIGAGSGGPPLGQDPEILKLINQGKANASARTSPTVNYTVNVRNQQTPREVRNTTSKLRLAS